MSKLIFIGLLICFCQIVQPAVEKINRVGTLPSISINNQSIVEGDLGDANIITFTVSLSQPSDQIITVRYATSEDTAIAELDFITTGGILTFQAQETSQQLPFEIIGDVLEEANERFEIELFSPINASIAVGTGVAVILDDDRLITEIPMLSIWSLLIIVITILHIYCRKLKKPMI